MQALSSLSKRSSRRPYPVDKQGQQNMQALSSLSKRRSLLPDQEVVLPAQLLALDPVQADFVCNQSPVRGRDRPDLG
jgi:hypothetical protein